MTRRRGGGRRRDETGRAEGTPEVPAPRPELDVVGTWVRILSLRTRLLAWYDREKRDLPWRRAPTPYRVLVSELMLQQTRVEVVVPYFERWMALWPDLASLAAAPLDDVLAAWSGLSYYRRARSLHRIAADVLREHGGKLPEDSDALQRLPGVGPYTAAAIASIAHGRVVAVVDGNVERVVCRLLGLQDEPGAERDRVVREAARRLVTGLAGEEPSAFRPDVAAPPNGPSGGNDGSSRDVPGTPPSPPGGLRPGDWNQAMMELGAVICTPLLPRCPVCPLARSCIANRAGLVGEIPRRREKRAPVEVSLRVALVRRGERFLLVRRPEGSLLSGLWELPTAEETETVAAFARRVSAVAGARVRLGRSADRTIRHTITHRRITVHVHEARIDEPPAGADPSASEAVTAVASTAAEARGGKEALWITRQELRDFGVSSMTKKALAGGAA